MIERNLRNIQQNIEKAAAKTNRRREDITLIGVTKTVEPARICELARLGVRDFGENRVQELLAKVPEVQTPDQQEIRWHMIGHLQRNKVKSILDTVCLIHSVDRYRLAEEIQIRAAARGQVQDILVEINIGEEESKQGIPWEGATNFVQDLTNLDNICVCGLMTVAPYVENPEKNRIFFRKMFQIFVDINENILNNKPMVCLSMGMTNDYLVAIEEGANMVRIGTGLFGSR